MRFWGRYPHPHVQACERHGKAAATLAGDIETAKLSMKRGFRLVSYGYDIGLLQGSLATGVKACRDWVDGNPSATGRGQKGTY